MRKAIEVMKKVALFLYFLRTIGEHETCCGKKIILYAEASNLYNKTSHPEAGAKMTDHAWSSATWLTFH